MQSTIKGHHNNLRYFFLIGVIILGLVTIIGTGGGGGDDDDNDGIPKGYKVYSNVKGYFKNGHFKVKKEGWSTYFGQFGKKVTILKWRDPEMGIRLDLQLPFSPNYKIPTFPITWQINRGGYIFDNSKGGVSVGIYGAGRPPGYEKFLGVSGNFTLTEFDANLELFKGSFNIVVGAFYLDNGFKYSKDPYYDTTFSEGNYDYQFAP